MGDRVATIYIMYMGRKEGVLCTFSGELYGPHLTQCGLWRDLSPYQVASWSIQPFGHNTQGPKSGGAVPPFGGELDPHLTQCRFGWGLPPYQVASWSMQPFGHKRHGPKIGGQCPFWRGGAESRSNTMWPEARPCHVLSWSIQPFGHNTPMSQTGQTDRQDKQTTVW